MWPRRWSTSSRRCRRRSHTATPALKICLSDPARPGGFVLIDWGFAGLAPVGYDLGQLLAGRANSGELDATDLPVLGKIVLDSYRLGLRDESVDVDDGAVHRGFVGGMLLRSGFSALPLGAAARPAGDGPPMELAPRARYARYLLDLGHQLGWLR